MGFVKFVKDSEYSSELQKMGFDPMLYASKEDCEDWYNHCKKYNMKFCKGTYGTLVHKNFGEYFKLSTMSHSKIPKILGVEGFAPHNPTEIMDHVNIFYWKEDNSMKMITTSPYNIYKPSLFDGIEDSEYSVYMIHPNLLDYYAFVTRSNETVHPLWNVNYAFIKPDDVWKMDDVISEDMKGIMRAFVLVHD